MRTFRFSLILFASLLFACDDKPGQTPADATLTLQQSDFAHLPGWGKDTLTEFVPAFRKSCDRLSRAPADQELGLPSGGTWGHWQSLCGQFASLEMSEASLHGFFEQHFVPYQVSSGDDADGLFTGYYEASLRGSLNYRPPYTTPLFRRPADLVMVQLGDFRDELKGQRIAGRVINGRLSPYESRAQIEAGRWPHTDNVLLWVDDPVDAFFLHIQGSGLVTLDDGTLFRVGYDGQNGHRYSPIGRTLIERGELSKETVSMQSIRQWLEANPGEARALMDSNPSYVFFRALDTDGPVGAEGVSLTPERSLAVDHGLWPYGLPVWVDIEPPKPGTRPLKRLMVMQDTGGAIKGAVRGDVFWGYGERAADLAGHMKSRGRYWVLLPKTAQ